MSTKQEKEAAAEDERAAAEAATAEFAAAAEAADVAEQARIAEEQAAFEAARALELGAPDPDPFANPDYHSDPDPDDLDQEQTDTNPDHSFLHLQSVVQKACREISAHVAEVYHGEIAGHAPPREFAVHVKKRLDGIVHDLAVNFGLQ